MLPLGTPAPLFKAPTPSSPSFNFGMVGGRYLVLAFPGPADLPMVREAVAARRRLFDDEFCAFFGVLREPGVIAAAADEPPGVRWFLDGDGTVSRLYGFLGEDGREQTGWVVLDPSMRVLATAPIADGPKLLAQVAGLPPVNEHAGVPMHAPVLIVPRVFEAAFCRRLIDVYEAQGGAPSGFMREVEGKTVEIRDPSHKRRSDCFITDPELKEAARARLSKRLLPEIVKAFQFTVTRIERDIVACYDSADAGFFRAHRDNTTKGTAHRKFAVTLNLNTGAYDGGELRFPEFGARTYRAPLGGAVVFSCSLLHEATPVTRGRRYAYLPFLYDEAGAAIREQNARFLAKGGSYSAGRSETAASA
ncbi:MAG: 2OG-Fe(II) oxygenase [Pseudomonadota bacterium]|nr:2OG-Fe(II) oxygenase [Pseudomonadota bacterium]